MHLTTLEMLRGDVEMKGGGGLVEQLCFMFKNILYSWSWLTCGAESVGQEVQDVVFSTAANQVEG